MPLMDALRAGVDLSNASNEAVIRAAQARYAHPLNKAQLLRADTENEFLPDKLRLANQYQGLVNQYYGPEHAAAIAHQNLVNKYYGPEKESSIKEREFFLQNPLLKMPGAAGQVGSAMYLQGLEGVPQGGGLAPRPNPMQEGTQVAVPGGSADGGLRASLPSSPSRQILENLNSLNKVRNARAELDTARKENFNWSQLPAETRNNLVAQGLGMGIDPVKMKDYITQGMGIQQIAEKEGLDPNNIPPPVYFPTTTTKTRTQQVQQVGAELDYMSSATTPIVGAYADTFLGKSPKLISDMLSNDPERQKQFGEYIGAMAIQTELANGRVLLAGGRSGIEIVRDLRAKSLQGIDKITPIRMTKEAFESAQKTIDTILQKGAKIRTMTGMSPFSGNKEMEENSDLSQMSDEELLRIAERR